MKKRNHVHLHKLKVGDAVPVSKVSSRREELPAELRKHLQALGPTPRTSLEVFTDLGLSDNEIARYFGVPEGCISKLGTIWGVRDLT